MAKIAHSGRPLDGEQALKRELAKRYDALNELWQAAEESVRSFMVPDAVEVGISTIQLEDPNYGVYAEEYEHLGWIKYGASWRLCHGYSDSSRPDDVSWKPIADRPIDVRCACVEHFATLLKKVKEQAAITLPKLDSVIDSFRKVLDGQEGGE